MIIFIIGLAHAIPFFFVCLYSKKKRSLIITAIIMSVIGVSTGAAAPVFAAVDLFFVAIGFIISWIYLNSRTLSKDEIVEVARKQHEKQVKQQEALLKQQRREEYFRRLKNRAALFFTLGVIIYVVLLINDPSLSPYATKSKLGEKSAPATIENSTKKDSFSGKSERKLKTNSIVLPDGDIRGCLDLPTNEDIIKCSESFKHE